MVHNSFINKTSREHDASSHVKGSDTTAMSDTCKVHRCCTHRAFVKKGTMHLFVNGWNEFPQKNLLSMVGMRRSGSAGYA